MIEISPGLVGQSPSVLLIVGLLLQCLDVGQRQVDFRVLELVVLVETTLAAVRLGAALHGAFVVALDLISIAPHSLALLRVTVTETGELIVFVFGEA